MAIKFYKNGTTGETDGTAISENGGFSNPIIADGFFPAAGVTLTKDITIHIRADAGEDWHFVFIALQSVVGNINMVGVVGGNCTYFESLNARQIGWYFERVPNVNTPITLRFKASGDESNAPDTSVRLAVIGGLQA